MPNHDIIEGLRFALVRGESLKQAMISFYNAGYKKEEIEEAARALQQSQVRQPVQQPTPSQKSQVSRIEPTQIQQPQKQIPQRAISISQKQIPLKTTQAVSNYGQPEKKSKLTIIILIFSLLILVGLLVSIFIFRDSILELFNEFF
ncbi:MAG: hypothetical protein ABIA78_04380 [archaeon]